MAASVQVEAFAVDLNLMGSVGDKQLAGRQAALLFVLSGLITIASTWLPGHELLNTGVMYVVGAAAVAVGATSWVLPWSRWPARATLLLLPLSFGLVAIGGRFGNVTPAVFSVYFVVVFTWVGLAHPPLTSLFLLPVASASYVVPLALTPGHPPGAIAAVVQVMAVGVLVAETISRTLLKLRRTLSELERTRAESQHRADLLAVVAQAAGTVGRLQRESVLAAVVDSVGHLGLEVAALSFFDDERHTQQWAYTRGLSEDLAHHELPASAGLTGLAREREATVVIDDYPAHRLAVHALVATGVRSAIATPVRVNDRCPAVLLAGSHSSRHFGPEVVEVFELLATQAGGALQNAEQFEDERRTRQALAESSVRDDLTGLGNRRHATTQLESLQPGDVVCLLDLDQFKQVNDNDGHAGGDRVLASLGTYLREQLRYEDTAARYGGEEFLVILRQAHDRGRASIERLIEGWRALAPRTTFSAGLAIHRDGQLPAATLGHADAALYAAKRLGRDRVCEFALEEPSSL